MKMKMRLVLILLMVFGVSFFLAGRVLAETTVPWCCVDSVGKSCKDITSVDTCPGGIAPTGTACKTISACPQYVSTNTGGNTGTGGGTGVDIPTDTGLPTNSGLVKGILVNVLNWLLSIIGIIAIIGFIISGFQYFMTGVDEKSVEKAKKTATASVIGIIIALSGYVVIAAVEKILKGTNF